jgi:hypothetical protein
VFDFAGERFLKIVANGNWPRTTPDGGRSCQA